MNAQERISALLNGYDAGIGLYENIWPETIASWHTQGYPEGCDPVELFGIDFGRLGSAFDASPRLYRRVLEDTPEWEIIEDGAGAVTKIMKHECITPGHIKWDMDSFEKWDQKYKPLLMSENDARIPVQKLREGIEKKRALGKWTCFNMTFIWEQFRQSVGDVCMYEALAMKPEWIHDYNSVMLELYKKHILRALELVGKPDGVWFSEDIAYNQGLFCSPKMLERLYLPYYADMVEFIHRLDMKVILHSCGNITAAMPLITEAGFDAIHPLQVRAGCKPLELARKYKEKLAFIGGFDLHIIETNDADKIEHEQISLMRGMREIGARYIFSSDHSISTNVSFDTYRRIVDTYYTLAERR